MKRSRRRGTLAAPGSLEGGRDGGVGGARGGPAVVLRCTHRGGGAGRPGARPPVMIVYRRNINRR